MTLGITFVNTVWATLALFGLRVLVTSVPVLFWLIRFLGAAYLVWFGIQLLRRSSRPLRQNDGPQSGTTFRSAMRDRLVTNLANPKSMAFYASVFSGAVPTHASNQTLITMIAMVRAIAALWYELVAVTLSTERMAALYRQGKAVIERTCGLFLIVLGGRQGLF